MSADEGVATDGGLLHTVRSPRDLRRMSPEALALLATEIREFLVAKVSRTGGHLGPNLGVVELTLAMHRVFDSPRDRFLFDTGHQAYVHKIVTGRQAGFDTLRQRGGLSGYPNQAESEHDIIENSHASTALSYADGMAKAFALRGEDRHVVVVVGDGALTGGMCWEALNNIAAARNRLVIIVNDNGRSYAPTIGGLANHLSTLRLNPGYEKVLDLVKDALGATPLVGRPMFEVLHAVKKGIKDAVAPQAMFEDLGIKYVGPVDGHDVEAVESALRRAKGFGGPVIVHAVTRKGNGYRPAEDDEADCLHGPGAFDPRTGVLVAAPSVKWTNVFAEELVAVADERPDVVGITAAMAEPTGIAALARKYPERVYDVGIAEQHAATSAAGLALGGLHPVVAVYATFLNRAFDQVLLDVAMHRLPVTFVLDRAGITGPDGPSHYGIWDMSVFGVVPGLRIAAPRDAATLRQELREAVAVGDGPTIIRFPTGTVADDLPALRHLGFAENGQLSGTAENSQLSGTAENGQLGGFAEKGQLSVPVVNGGLLGVNGGVPASNGGGTAANGGPAVNGGGSAVNGAGPAVDGGYAVNGGGSGDGGASASTGIGVIDVLAESERKDVLLVAVGAFAAVGVDVAARVGEQGYGVTVVDPRWVRPVPEALVGLAAEHRLVVTLEDGVRAGGVGDAVSKALRDAEIAVPLRDIGVPPGWHPQGSRAQILADLRLTAQDVARDVTGWLSRLDAAADPVPVPGHGHAHVPADGEQSAGR